MNSSVIRQLSAVPDYFSASIHLTLLLAVTTGMNAELDAVIAQCIIFHAAEYSAGVKRNSGVRAGERTNKKRRLPHQRKGLGAAHRRRRTDNSVTYQRIRDRKPQRIEKQPFRRTYIAGERGQCTSSKQKCEEQLSHDKTYEVKRENVCSYFLRTIFLKRICSTPRKASLKIFELIFETPSTRSMNVMGTSTTLKPRRCAVYFISIWKA